MKWLDTKNNNLLFPGAKVNFQKFTNLELTKDDLSFLHLISSVVSGGNLNEICFYNASFLSTKFSNVTFENCNLKSADLCSIWAKDCLFKNTDFNQSTISDSTFVNCVFDDSTFLSISLINCQFINCIFEQMPIDDSTVTLNAFTGCQIKHTHFTDSFNYQLFDKCIFSKVDVSPNLIGYNYGFPKDVLLQLDHTLNLQELEEDFINKGLYINAALLHINQTNNYYDIALVACVTALIKMIQHDILVKADEIRFLKNLTAYFEEQNLITPISILRIWKILNELISDNIQNTAMNKAIPYIREFINMIYYSFQQFLADLDGKLNLIPQLETSDTANLKIVYYDEPSFNLQGFLSDLATLISPYAPSPKLLRTEKGSFIEFWEIAGETIPYLQTFLAFLGVVTPIVIYQQQKKEQPKSHPQKNIEVTVITSSSTLSPNTTNISTETNLIVSDTVKILNKQSLINEPGFCGYNSQNIQSITINIQ